MLKQPLFGEDSSPHITSMFLSGIITLIGWILFCILSLVIKFKPQTPQYKEVQIVLSSTPVEEKSEPSAVPEPVEGLVEEAAAAAEESVLPEPVEGQPVEAPKATPAPAKAQTKTQPAKTTTSTPKTPESKKVNFDDYQYATRVDDAMNNQFSNSSPNKQFRDDLFTDDDNSYQENTKTNSKVIAQSGMDGSAGTTGDANRPIKSSQQDKSPYVESPGKDVEKARDRIMNANGNNNSGGASSNDPTTPSGKTTSFEFSWEGSGKRTQLSSLSIDLGNNTIESTRTVTIRIKVLESGYVDRGSIDIDVSSLLTKEIRESIYDSISKWRFNSSNAISIATFKYTIEKR